MNEQSRSWVEVINVDDAEALWNKLFKLVSRHSAIRNVINSSRTGPARLQDLNTDITQDLFLKLHRKGRWQHYIDANYADTDIEHELYHIELPNLASLLLRERHPEAYRISRRISTLVQTRDAFRRFAAPAVGKRVGKLALKVYGLSEWGEDKPFKPHQDLHGLIKDVSFRIRDRRRAGRNSSSQIIISNSDLTDLLVEIFKVMDSPSDIRMVRSLALSKLPIEDSRFVSLDAAISPDGIAEREPLKVDFADSRPTPEQVMLETESTQQVEGLAVELLDKMREVVRNKPTRFSRLALVAWHCYFDVASPTQTRIATMIGISNSLVSHYRKIFDGVIRNVPLDEGQYIPFLHAFGARLQMSIPEPTVQTSGVKSQPQVHAPHRAFAFTAGAANFN